MRLEHHLVGGYVRNISPYIIIINTTECGKMSWNGAMHSTWQSKSNLKSVFIDSIKIIIDNSRLKNKDKTSTFPIWNSP